MQLQRPLCFYHNLLFLQSDGETQENRQLILQYKSWSKLQIWKSWILLGMLEKVQKKKPKRDWTTSYLTYVMNIVGEWFSSITSLTTALNGGFSRAISIYSQSKKITSDITAIISKVRTRAMNDDNSVRVKAIGRTTKK